MMKTLMSKYVPLNPQDYLKADATNIYTAGFGSLTIDSTHPLRILQRLGEQANMGKGFLG